MHTEVIPNTQDFNETALYHFYTMIMNKHSNSLYFFSLVYKSRGIEHYSYTISKEKHRKARSVQSIHFFSMYI